MESLRHCTLRGQLELVPSDTPVNIDDVETAAEIVKRFVTGKNNNGSNNRKNDCHSLIDLKVP